MNREAFYDRSLRAAPYVIAAVFLLQAVLSNRLEKWVHPVPFEESAGFKIDKRIASTTRASALLSGYKVLIGHAFWIRVIQYYGDTDNAADHYAKLYDYCRLSSDLNPQFIPIYTYGAAALGFQLNRPIEAEQLLQKGIEANPKENRLKLMYAALVYQNSTDYGKSIPFLEVQIARGDAPTMLVNILANTYKEVGRYADAARLWKRILLTTDSDEEKIQAAQKLQEIKNLLKAGARGK